VHDYLAWLASVPATTLVCVSGFGVIPV